jgi:hypothetical protein
MPASGRRLSGPWYPPGLGACSLWLPSQRRVLETGEDWALLRPSNAEHVHWSWERIRSKAHECLALIAEESHETLCLWAARTVSRQPLLGQAYLLQFLEVAPSLPRARLGMLAVCLSAGRSLELGCVEMRVPALPRTVTFYERLGAHSGPEAGWSAPNGTWPAHSGVKPS